MKVDHVRSLNEVFVLSAATSSPSERLHLPHELNLRTLFPSESHPEECHSLPQLDGSEPPSGPDGSVDGKNQVRGLCLVR